MGIKLSIADQTKLLRDTGISIEEKIAYLGKVDFCESLVEYCHELQAIEDVINDSCVLSLKTPEEIEELEQETRAERDHIAMERSAYHSQVL